MDDLTNQLRDLKASTVPATDLASEQENHAATRQLLDEKSKEITEVNKEITSLNNRLQQMGQAGVTHKEEKGTLESQIIQLSGVIEGQNQEIDDLLLRRSQLE